MMDNIGSGKRVVVVDDSKTIRGMVSFILRDMGFEVIAAADGQEALETLMTNKVTLIITDWNMPVMDGPTLVGEVRNKTVNKVTPILMVTTENDQAKITQARELGATGWIVKPFTPDKLKKVVEKICGAAL